MGLLFSRRRVPSCRKHASHTGERRLRRPCVRCLAPLGQGALPVCVFDAVCPAGQKRCRGARRILVGSRERVFCGAFCPSGNFPGAPGNGKRSRRTFSSGVEMYAVSRAERALLPVKSSTSSYRRKRGTLQDAPHHPRVSRRMRAGVQDYLPALPAAPPSPDHPAGRSAGSACTRSRVQTLENPFLGDGNRFPRGSRLPTAAGRRPLLVGRLPCMRFAAGTETKCPCPLLVGHGCVNTEPTALSAGTAGPQADGPCSWAVRRVCALPPDRNETKQDRPLLMGRTCVTHAPKATGRRHCRLCPHPLKGPNP